MNESTMKRWEETILRYQERLRLPYYWYPYPALISVALVYILSGHILPGINPRLGSMANVLSFKAKRQNEGSIWIGAYPDKGQIVIQTGDRHNFRWPLNTRSEKDISAFILYLKERVKKESVATGLSLQTSLTKISAVLAIDQRLNYGQIQPIITALAQAKISRYGFETQTIKRSNNQSSRNF